MAKSKKLGLGILIGAIVGVVTGLLAAPKSGRETRKDIKNKAKEVKGTAERKLKDMHKDLGKLADETKSKAKQLEGKAKDELSELSEKAEELKGRVKSAITSIKSGDSDDDDVTVDQLVKDLNALKKKIASKVKG